jgi:DNA-binding PucR family transcriptional regulator
VRLLLNVDEEIGSPTSRDLILDSVLRLVPPGSVAAVEDVLPQVLLLHLQSHLADQPHLRLPAVQRMVDHDAEQQTPYVESVLAYLAANADVPAAAESVNVHPNTFRYRLRRVRELFDLDLEDPDVRLVVWLQLRTQL